MKIHANIRAYTRARHSPCQKQRRALASSSVGVIKNQPKYSPPFGFVAAASVVRVGSFVGLSSSSSNSHTSTLRSLPRTIVNTNKHTHTRRRTHTNTLTSLCRLRCVKVPPCASTQTHTSSTVRLNRSQHTRDTSAILIVFGGHDATRRCYTSTTAARRQRTTSSYNGHLFYAVCSFSAVVESSIKQIHTST